MQDLQRFRLPIHIPVMRESIYDREIMGRQCKILKSYNDLRPSSSKAGAVANVVRAPAWEDQFHIRGIAAEGIPIQRFRAVIIQA